MVKPGADQDQSATSIASAPTRLGRYELSQKLGSGGMATVFLGRLIGEEGFERWVAVKRIHEHLADDPRFREMFLDEARLAARLHQPNLVQVTDIGVEGGVPFLVMEYVNGETLADLLRRCMSMSQPLPYPIAARILASTCEGIHHAHELRHDSGEPLGLVHRDVSPQNVMISYDGAVKLTDFGIAKAVGRASDTQTGHLKGKLGYMSPEQALAQPLDRRSDVFSLGVVLYEASLSRRLFRSDSELETLQRITTGDIPRPQAIHPGYPAELERILLRALRVRPDERYQTARDMQADLERYLASLGQPLGSFEISRLMQAAFEDRMRARATMLAQAAELGQAGTAIDIPGLQDDSTSLSLPQGLGAEAQPSSGRLRSALLLLVGAVVIALAVLVGTLLPSLWTAPSRAGAADEAGLAALAAPEEDGAGLAAAAMEPDAEGRALLPPPSDASATAPPEASATASPDASATPAAADAEATESTLPSPRPHTAGPPHRRPPPPQPPGAISVIANPWCEVLLGGRRLGRTPLMRVELPPGRHVLHLLPQGQGPAQTRAVTVRSGQLTPVSVDLTR